ncbi:MAG: FTR1 family protein [Anaerolineales bacterium]
MLPSFLLTLREGVEVSLIIGIILGTLSKLDKQHLRSSVWLGVGVASITSLGAAVIIYSLGTSFSGRSEEIFEGVTMVIAAIVLTWVIFWMNRQARNINQDLEADVRSASSERGRWALFSLAFFAVLREGIEIGLFLTTTTFTLGIMRTILGAVLGLVVAIAVTSTLVAGMSRMRLQTFFLSTSIMLILFSAGLVGHAVHEFNEANLIPAIVDPLWDVSHILSESSTLGQTSKALFGYNANPSLTEVVAYFGYYVFILLMYRFYSPSSPARDEISIT